MTTPKTAAGDTIPSGFSIGTGVIGVKDSAELSVSGGQPTPSGTVTFHLCKVDAPSLCDSGGTPIGSAVAVTGTQYPATVTSPTAYVTSAGRYCWRADYSGDGTKGIPSSSDSRATECFTVAPVTPTLTTDASDSVLLGGKVKDSATLSGTATMPADPVINTTGTAGAPDDGTITFRLYGPSTTACGALAYVSPAPGVAVSGDGTYSSAEVTPAAPGTYHWVAQYTSGSANTVGVTHDVGCADPAEAVVITTVPSSMTTAQKWVPNDSATITASAGGSLAGSVKFEFFLNAMCSGTPDFTQNVAVSGTSPVTVGTTNTTARTTSGSFSWRVTYDSTNSAQRDIPATCLETSALTVSNGGTAVSP